MSINDYSNVGLASSSGYPVYSGLRAPVFREAFQTRLYAETIASMVTSQSMIAPEVRSGQTDTQIMQRAPRGEIFVYDKNKHLEISSFASSTYSFHVDKAWYTNLKLDHIDNMPGSAIQKWVKAFMDDTVEQLGAIQDHGVMQSMVVGAHDCNKGARAGVRSHMFNLGDMLNPLTLTASGAVNPLSLTAQMTAVLAEQNVTLNRGFVIWPTMVQPLFLGNNILANAYASGLGQSTLVTGQVKQIMGLRHFFSANSPVYRDASGNPYYPVIMGLPSATAFTQVMRSNKVILDDPRGFSNFFRGLFVAGWGVMEPCQIAVAFVRIEPIFS